MCADLCDPFLTRTAVNSGIRKFGDKPSARNRGPWAFNTDLYGAD